MEDAYSIFLPKSSSDEFYLSFAGKSKCESDHTYGPNVRQNFVIHYVISGKGIYSIGNRTYEVEAGQCFFIEPHVLTTYKADKENPWSYIWFGFGGLKAEEYLKNIGVSDGKLIFSSSFGTELEELLKKLFELNAVYNQNAFLGQSILYSLFDILSRDHSETKGVLKSDYENGYVQRAIDFIKENFSNDITVQNVADYVNIDRSYLFSLFKKERGCSLQKWMTDYRMSYAKELLASTDYSVETICYSCGYSDSGTFSKSFKRNVGKTPIQYRKWEREFHEKQYAKVRKK